MSPESSTTDTSFSDKEKEALAVAEPEEEPLPPLSDQIIELWKSISVPFQVCRHIQIWLLCAIVLGYVMYTTVVVVVVWNRSNYTSVTTYCDQEHSQWTEDVTHARKLENGSRVKHNLVFPKTAMWNYSTFVRGCPCKFKTCVRKCCPLYQMYESPANLTCTDRKTKKSMFDNLTNHVYSFEGYEEWKMYRKSAGLSQDQFKIIDRFADCGKYLGYLGARYEIQQMPTYLLANGVALTDDGVYLDIDDYCMEHTLTTGDDVITVRCMSIRLLHEIKSWMTRERSRGEWVSLISTFVSLVLTAFIFVFLPQLRNIHGKLIFGFIVVLTLNYMQYLVHYFQPPVEVEYLWQFTYLSQFCWLTALGFDVWLSFSGTLQVISPWQETKRLLWHCLFTLGCPAVFTALTWAVGVVPNHTDSCRKPLFEEDPCVFTMIRTTRLFLYLPIITLLTLNLVIYLSTTYNMKRHLEHVTGKAFFNTPCGRPSEIARYGFRLYSKLLAVMIFTGICLLLLTTPYNPQCTFFHQHLNMIFYGKGVILFIVFCLNHRVLKLLFVRWLELNMKKDNDETSSML